MTRLVTGLVPNLRAFAWAWSALRDIHRRLPTEGTEARVTPPAGLGPRGLRGVIAASTIARPTCLERALVLQGWFGAQGLTPDVVVGVRKGGGKVEAHAWIDGRDPWFDPGYREIARLTP